MSPWLFNILFDRVVRQINKKATRKGAEMRDGRGKEWEIRQLISPDDTALMAESREDLQNTTSESGRECDIMKLKNNFY